MFCLQLRRAERTGFTLIELLVAIAIMATLIALLLPAVQSARASARRMACANQLRQLGLALHIYHDSHRCFPPGSLVMGPSFPTRSGWGWGAMILPFVEQSALYLRVDFHWGTGVGGNLDLISTPIPAWRCPSEPAPDRLAIRPLNYPPLELASGNYCGSDGVLSEMSRVRLAHVTDGTSQTLLLGERMVQTGEDKTLPFTSAWCGQLAFQNEYEYRSVPHLRASREHPINGSTTDPACFGSRHAGGANFALVDGSGRFLNESIDEAVFEALGTPNRGDHAELP